MESGRPGAGVRRGSGISAILRGLLIGVAAFAVARGLTPHRPYVSAYERDDYERAMERLLAAEDDGDRYCALVQAAKTAVYFGPLEEAQAYATELLEMASSQDEDWSYGNAVHDGHVVLGLVALRQGREDDAAKELLLAGETPGSPQLDTFGPNMLLAKELLEHGDRATVAAYFALCRRFWDMERGRLDAWTEDVRAGRMPDFGANLVF